MREVKATKTEEAKVSLRETEFSKRANSRLRELEGGKCYFRKVEDYLERWGGLSNQTNMFNSIATAIGRTLGQNYN